MFKADPVLKQYFPWLLLVGILLNIPGLWLDIMEPDGALYAGIAKHMVLHHDWINLYGDGHDWLDKPHFPFWMAAISYKIFGINGFAYKFPAFVFWLIGLGYTYLTAKQLFNVPVALVAVLLSTVALHSTLANFDVRAEPYLTTCIVAAIWHMICVYYGRHWFHMVGAAFFIACAMMTKGTFILITIGGGWVLFWMISRQWDQFANYRWWLILGLSFVFLLPELYSLYIQFDMHPEKVVFGKTNVSGIKFFFWDSQFGRFFNTGPIKGKGNVTFFMHTVLWAFLPWSIGLVSAVIYLARFDKSHQPARWIIYGSALVTFVLFSLSKFQLPHYIVIEFPYFSIITAYFFYELATQAKLGRFVMLQTVVLVLVEAGILLLLYITGIRDGLVAAAITLVILIGAVVARYKNPLQQLLFKGYAMAAVLYIFLFQYFYPFLLQYQSGRQAARLIPKIEKNIPVAAYRSFSYSFEFYSPGDVSLIKTKDQLSSYIKQTPCFLYTTKDVADSLKRSGLSAQVLAEPMDFRITRLKMAFLNKEKREATLETRCLLYFKSKI